MVVWEEPPASIRASADYQRASNAIHARPGHWARVFHDEVYTQDEKSLIRVKWAQAMDRRCDQCRVKAVTTGKMYSIYIIHGEESHEEADSQG